MDQHVRVPLQHTFDHVNCPACEATRLDLSRKTDMRHLKFKDAAELVLVDEHFYLLEENAGLVLEDKTLRVGSRTYSDHIDFARRLNRFFGEIPLDKIHEGHWREYQKHRGETAGPALINHETSFLSRVLDRAGLWKDLKPRCPSLEVPKSTRGRAMSPEEEQLIFITAASRPRWKTFYLGGLLMLNTTRPQGEILFLRVKDLDMKLRILSFREGRGVLKAQPDGGFRRAMKTTAREKDLPMHDTIFWICTQLLKRYHRICRRLKIDPSPDHYLFPGRRRGGKLDPTRPMRSFKKAWAGICAHIGLQARGIDVDRDADTLRKEWTEICARHHIQNPRIEDLRHHASTKMQEDPLTAPGTVEHVMGHAPGSRTKDDYRHTRHQAALEALKRIEVKPVRSVEAVDNVVQLPRSQAVAGSQKSS